MARRKGMMVGSGKRGYHNIIGKDPKVHSDSAKGRKQPQRVPKFIRNGKIYGHGSEWRPSPMKDRELAKVIRNLDPLEHRIFLAQLGNGNSPKKAMEVVVNTVEGDDSQLSPELRKYAKKEGWLEGYGNEPEKDTDGDGVPDKYDCSPNDPKKDFSADVILQQLGGNRFIAMTGAKSFVKDDKKKTIWFRIPRANGINVVEIHLNGKDLYDIKFKYTHGTKLTTKKEINNVYFDQLQDIFTETTGLYTHL